MFSKVLAEILLMSLGIILSILVMMYGWGLEPKSWRWIIGVGIITQIIIEMIKYINIER